MTLLSNELVFLAADKSALSGATGGFARRLAVLAAAEPDFAQTNRAFLVKVLAAANLDLAQDALFAELASGEAVAIAPDLRERKPQKVLVFGIKPEALGLLAAFLPYQPLEFYGAQWLFADALSVLEADKAKKGQLWSAMKQMFF